MSSDRSTKSDIPLLNLGDSRYGGGLHCFWVLNILLVVAIIIVCLYIFLYKDNFPICTTHQFLC